MTGYFICNNINAGAPRPNHLNDRVSPINSPLSGGNSMLMRYLHSGLSLDHDQYSSPKISHQIVNYHYHSSSDSSRSPLSAVENLERSPLPATAKVHDDVLVMDGILVGSAARKGGRKLWSPANSDCGGTSSASASASWENSGSSSGYKTEGCRSWEDTGNCRYGHKCKFAHGQEELCPAHTGVPNRNKIIELVARQPYFSPLSSTSSPLSTFSLETMRKAPLVKVTAPSKLNKASPTRSNDTPTASLQSPSTDWSPLDDGIAVTLPSATGNPPSGEASIVVTSPSSTGTPPSRKAGIVVTSPSSTGYPPLRNPGIVVTSPSSTGYPPLRKPGIVVTSPSSTGSPPWRKPGIVVTLPSSTGNPPSRKGGIVLQSPSSTGSPWRTPGTVVTSPSSTGNPPSREAGIAVTAPSSAGNSPSREAVDEHIHNVLYGPTRKKRLPVFDDFCPQ